MIVNIFNVQRTIKVDNENSKTSNSFAKGKRNWVINVNIMNNQGSANEILFCFSQKTYLKQNKTTTKTNKKKTGLTLSDELFQSDFP